MSHMSNFYDITNDSNRACETSSFYFNVPVFHKNVIRLMFLNCIVIILFIYEINIMQLNFIKHCKFYIL